MTSRLTLGLLTAALALLCAIAYWDDAQTQTEQRKALAAKLVFAFEPDDVTRIELSQKDGPLLALARQSVTSWALVSPVSYPADDRVVMGILQTLAHYSQQKIISSDRDKWPIYGLTAQSPRVTIHLASTSKPLSLVIGDKTQVGYNVYFAKDGQPHVYLGSQYLLMATTRRLDEFRSKYLVTIDKADLTTFFYERAGHPPVHLAKDGAGGLNFVGDNGQAKTAVDKVAFFSFLSALENLQVDSFVAPPFQAELKEVFASRVPVVSLRWADSRGNGDQLKVFYWRERLLATLTSREIAFELPMASLHILTRPQNDWSNANSQPHHRGEASATR